MLPPEALNAIMLGQCGSSDEARWPAVEADAPLREARRAEPVGQQRDHGLAELAQPHDRLPL